MGCVLDCVSLLCARFDRGKRICPSRDSRRIEELLHRYLAMCFSTICIVTLLATPKNARTPFPATQNHSAHSLQPVRHRSLVLESRPPFSSSLPNKARTLTPDGSAGESLQCPPSRRTRARSCRTPACPPRSASPAEGGASPAASSHRPAAPPASAAAPAVAGSQSMHRPHVSSVPQTAPPAVTATTKMADRLRRRLRSGYTYLRRRRP